LSVPGPFLGVIVRLFFSRTAGRFTSCGGLAWELTQPPPAPPCGPRSVVGDPGFALGPFPAVYARNHAQPSPSPSLLLLGPRPGPSPPILGPFPTLFPTRAGSAFAPHEGIFPPRSPPGPTYWHRYCSGSPKPEIAPAAAFLALGSDLYFLLGALVLVQDDVLRVAIQSFRVLWVGVDLAGGGPHNWTLLPTDAIRR